MLGLGLVQETWGSEDQLVWVVSSGLWSIAFVCFMDDK